MKFPSLFRREAVVRRETSRFSPDDSSLTGKNSPPSFVSELIRGGYSNPDSPANQRKMAMLNPVAYNAVFKLANNVWDDGWEFIDSDGNVIMQDIKLQMDALNADYYFTQALIMERIYGHGWLFKGKEKMRADVRDGTPLRIANLDVFSPEMTRVAEYDDYGNPSVIEVSVKTGLGASTMTTKIPISADDLYLLRTRPRPHERSHTGIPVLYPVWSLLWSLERSFHSSDFYLAKFGYGMYTVMTERNLSDEALAKLQTTMESSSVSRVSILPGQLIKSIDFVNATGSPIDFPAEIHCRMGLIAAGLGVPLDLLIGLSAGSISGGEVNLKELYATLAQIQTSVMPMIRDLATALGSTRNDYGIRFITRYAHDEEQQSKIALNNATTLAIEAGWLTVNEIRDKEGLPPTEGGDRLKSDFDISVAGFQTPEEKEATNNPTGENT